MKRGKGLSPIGRRARRDQEDRDEVRRIVLGEFGERCAGKVVQPGIRCWGPLEIHEVVDRSVRPGVHLDSDFCVPLCRPHHAWVSDDATRAREDGFSFFSWDWEAAKERVVELRNLAWKL